MFRAPMQSHVNPLRFLLFYAVTFLNVQMKNLCSKFECDGQWNKSRKNDRKLSKNDKYRNESTPFSSREQKEKPK